MLEGSPPAYYSSFHLEKTRPIEFHISKPCLTRVFRPSFLTRYS